MLKQIVWKEKERVLEGGFKGVTSSIRVAYELEIVRVSE